MKLWPAGVLAARATEVKAELATCGNSAGRTSAGNLMCGYFGRIMRGSIPPLWLSLSMDFA